jgi:uncharacterized Rmd1/YagE family protein
MNEKFEFISNTASHFIESRHSKKAEISEYLVILLIFTEVCIATIHHISGGN